MQTNAEGGLDGVVRDHFFPRTSDGVFVDVGAAGPNFLSMSALYRALGWRVVAIEPNPVFCAAHRALGHEVLEYACSDQDADGVPFEVVDSHGTRYEGGKVSFESFSSLRVKTSYLAARLDRTRCHADPVRVRRLDSAPRRARPRARRWTSCRSMSKAGNSRCSRILVWSATGREC